MDLDGLGLIWSEFVMINENSRGEGGLAEMRGKIHLLEKNTKGNQPPAKIYQKRGLKK